MNPRRWRWAFSVLVFAASLLTAEVGDGESEVTKAYEVYIVVHVARNRLLTDVFRERIERELRDGFRAGLGDMGRVKVMHEHPRLPEVLVEGLQSLNSWTE